MYVLKGYEISISNTYLYLHVYSNFTHKQIVFGNKLGMSMSLIQVPNIKRDWSLVSCQPELYNKLQVGPGYAYRNFQFEIKL